MLPIFHANSKLLPQCLIWTPPVQPRPPTPPHAECVFPVRECVSAWLPSPYLSPIARLITAHIPQHCLLWLCEKLFFSAPPRSGRGKVSPVICDNTRASGRASERAGEQAGCGAGQTLLLQGLKQIKCQPLKRWLHSRRSGPLIPLENNWLPHCAPHSEDGLAFFQQKLSDIMHQNENQRIFCILSPL